MKIPTSTNIPWKPDDAAIKAKGGYILNEKQVEYLKQLVKALISMYSDIANVVNNNRTDYDALATHALLGDGTAGRALRMGRLTIADGTNPSTLKCTLVSEWNGDAIAATDNIAKGATTGDFTLNAAGTILTVELGDVLGCMGFVGSGIVNNVYTAGVNVVGADLTVRLRAGATNQDLTVLVDSDTYNISLLYVTSA